MVYVAGPFRGPDHWAIAENIRSAERVAFKVWQAGAVALCPHLNTAHFQGALPDHMWLDGDLALLELCDALILVPGWERSEGTKAEVAFATRHSIPVLFDIDSLRGLIERSGQ